jgi:hypothetical protein
MPYKIWVAAANPSYNVTIYSRAGDIPLNDYNIEYSPDNSNWYYVAGPLASTTCTQHSTVSISTGIIYIRAINDSTNIQIYGRGSNSSTCPGNAAFICTYQATITGTEDVAYTVYVDGNGDFQDCSV